MIRPISKILIANRGEIACRIIRTARAKGIGTVAICSEADADALHVRMADEAVLVGPAAAAESYLRGDRIIEAARRTGADAIHPGYGFLSENAGFARAVGDAGLIFIGPSPEAIEAMGDKAEAKRRMIAAGVPCVPGYHGADQSDERLLDEAGRIGFPVMIKASAGGGGRGMRIVGDPQDLAPSLQMARSEARNAFGDDRMLLEKAVVEPRHVEIQVFGDHQGHVVHLGERDCSIQRRHQKVIEEAPSPAVDAELRRAMGAAAVAAAKTLAYVGAGTVEFLLDAQGGFYFLEMNTRLQVEHPVTEMVTGIDLVALQIDVAEGHPLPFAQDNILLRGHAIEARLYAEDPVAGFLPQTGMIEVWHPASGEGVRVDHGLRVGDRVQSFYDPMLAKIVAHGATREEARRRLVTALAETRLHSVSTNRAFLMAALEDAGFIGGEATTAFIARTWPDGFRAKAAPDHLLPLAAALLCKGGAWRSALWSASRMKLAVDDGEPEWLSVRGHSGQFEVTTGGGVAVPITLLDAADGVQRYRLDGVTGHIGVHHSGADITFDLDGEIHRVRDLTMVPPVASADHEPGGLVRAPITGTVISFDVREGDAIERGQRIATLEAMKMQHMVLAPVAGRVVAVGASQGAQVAVRDLLVEIAEAEARA